MAAQTLVYVVSAVCAIVSLVILVVVSAAVAYIHQARHSRRRLTNCYLCRMKTWRKWRKEAREFFQTVYKGSVRFIAKQRAHRRYQNQQQRHDWRLAAWKLNECPLTPALHRSTMTRFLGRLQLSTSPFRLLDLPVEVRNIVYKCFAHSFIFVDCRPTDLLTPQPKYKIHTALLRTCRQTRFEFHPFLFSSTLFIVHDRYRFYRHLGMPFGQHVRELEVHGRLNRRGVSSIDIVLYDTLYMPNLRELHLYIGDIETYYFGADELVNLVLGRRTVLPKVRYLMVALECPRSWTMAVRRTFRNMKEVVDRTTLGVFQVELMGCNKTTEGGRVTATQEYFVIKRQDYKPRWKTRMEENGLGNGNEIVRPVE